MPALHTVELWTENVLTLINALPTIFSTYAFVSEVDVRQLSSNATTAMLQTTNLQTSGLKTLSFCCDICL